MKLYIFAEALMRRSSSKLNYYLITRFLPLLHPTEKRLLCQNSHLLLDICLLRSILRKKGRNFWPSSIT